MRSRRRQVTSSVDSTCPRCTARRAGQTSTSAASDSLHPPIDTQLGALESEAPIISASVDARAWAAADWRGCPGYPQLGRGATGIAIKDHTFRALRQRLRSRSGTRNVAQGMQFATWSMARLDEGNFTSHGVMPSPSSPSPSLPFTPAQQLQEFSFGTHDLQLHSSISLAVGKASGSGCYENHQPTDSPAEPASPRP